MSIFGSIKNAAIKPFAENRINELLGLEKGAATVKEINISKNRICADVLLPGDDTSTNIDICISPVDETTFSISSISTSREWVTACLTRYLLKDSGEYKFELDSVKASALKFALA